MFFVYIAYNKVRNKTYTGQSVDLNKRILRHNGILKNKSTSYTSKNRGLWIIIYSEMYSTRSEVLKREKWFKSGIGREYIKKHIQIWINESQLVDPPQADF